LGALIGIEPGRARMDVFQIGVRCLNREPPDHRSVAVPGKAGDARQRRTPRRNAMPTADRREPRQEDAESERTGAVHGGQPVAHSKHRDDCGGVRLRRGLYRPRAQPDLARNRGWGVRRGIGHGDHADRPGNLARPARCDPHPRLRRAGGHGAACPERHRGQGDRRSLPLCTSGPPLGLRQRSTARLCRDPAGRRVQGPQRTNHLDGR
jgi:hypothetical protein